MSNLNELLKRQVQSRNIGKPTMIQQVVKRRSCPGCNRKKLLASKINDKINRLK